MYFHSSDSFISYFKKKNILDSIIKFFSCDFLKTEVFTKRKWRLAHKSEEI